jgi:multicomponent Na+:H+ antiporter subunit E
MRRVLVSVVWATLVWVALWESLTWANIVGGLLAGIVVVTLVPPRPDTLAVGSRPVAGLKLLFYFLWKLVEASVAVAWEIATPGDRTNPAVIAVSLHTSSEGIITSVANMVSLTPGTLTLDVDPDTRTLYIHVLHFISEETTRADVHTLERLALAAFPPVKRTGGIKRARP